MDPRLVKHLKVCQLNKKRYVKLTKLINSLLMTCETGDELIMKLADKCFRQSDKELGKLEAMTFMVAFYGSVEAVMSNGPERAIEILLSKRYTKSSKVRKRKVINVELIQKCKSANFNAHLHQPKDANDLETHPMWTRKLKQYLIGPTLGIGGTAKVKLAYDTKTKKRVAMKILEHKYASAAYKEISILKKLDHKNIVRVYDCFQNVQWGLQRMTIFVIEYAMHGELIEFLMYTSKFEDGLARWLFTSLIEGIEYCHGQKIIHRDLKHDNCLLGKNFVLKITDFGFATHYDDELMKTAVGTKQYAAPEILKGRKYTDAVDIFSMGVMLFIALAGSQPWRTADAKNDRWYRMVHKGKWNKFFEYHKRSHKFSEEQKTILMGVLEPNPDKRWTLKDIKRCKWFNGKKIAQNDVELRLQKRKRSVDIKKFQAMSPGVKIIRKAVDIFSQRLPHVYFQPAPRLSFVTDKKAEWVLEDVANVIANLQGKITNNDREKYKLTFHVNSLVETGRYIDKKTKEMEYEKVRVVASVQMWTHPGQKQALENREKVLATVSENNEEQKEAIGKNIPIIKSIAIFRAEGGGETKYLFPAIYSDILLALPQDLISKDFMDVDDDIKEE